MAMAGLAVVLRKRGGCSEIGLYEEAFGDSTCVASPNVRPKYVVRVFLISKIRSLTCFILKGIQTGKVRLSLIK